MPNHVTNRVVVTGPAAAIAAFRQAFFAETVETDRDGREHRIVDFDFNCIIPRPEILNRSESSSSVTDGLIVLGRLEILSDRFGDRSLDSEIARYLSSSWVQQAGVTDYDGLKTLLTERDPTCVAKAEIAIRAWEECGHASWYSWSLANWGTKWNAYSCEIIGEDDERLDFRFDTAWSPPEPVFEALAERPECADLEIIIRGFDEGWFFAYRARISDGCYDVEDAELSDDFCREVYGGAEPGAAAEGEGDETAPTVN